MRGAVRASAEQPVASTSYAVAGTSSSRKCSKRGGYPGAPRPRRLTCRASAGLEEASAPPASSPKDLGSATRADFPILHQNVNGRPLVYLDNAATSHKPWAVIEAMSGYYEQYNSNVHRGVHALSARATSEYELAREKIARFVNAGSPQEIVYTRNASEAINLVAASWGGANLRPGDEVVLSVAEHHSNIVPWQLLAQRTGAVLKFVELTASEELDLQHLSQLITPRTRLVSLVHVSNMLGCVLPVHKVAEMAHAVGAKLLLDCCQSVPNMPVDVQALGADFIVASSHKMCGPTGIGFLWGRYELLSEMPPWMGGGEMIQEVLLEGSTYAEPPSRFEAGTPAIAEAIGWGAACDYLSGLGMERVAQHERELGGYLYDRLRSIDQVRIYGPPPEAAQGRAALATFNVEGIHPTDISTILDSAGVAVRSGHLCTQPVHRHLGIASSVRASAYIYNTPAEVDAFIESLKDSINFFSEMGM